MKTGMNGNGPTPAGENRTAPPGYILAGASLLVLALPYASAACPYCESEVGQEVAAGIFNEDFGRNSLLTLLPLPVLLVIVALIHFGFPASIGATPGAPEGKSGAEAAGGESPRQGTFPLPSIRGVSHGAQS